MASWIDRVKVWTEIGFKDPEERVERAMVRVLLIGNAALALVGLFDLLRVHTAKSSVQFAAACLFLLLILWMDHSGRAYPRTLLLVAALSATATLYVAGANADYYWLTDPEPVVFISTTGVLAMVLGGRWVRSVAVVWSIMVMVAVAAARWPVTHSYGQVASDAATVMIVLALTFSAVVAVQTATRQGQAKYEQLMQTAPVGIIELDLRPLRHWLQQQGYETFEDYRKGVQSGDLDPRLLGRKLIIHGYNNMASMDLLLDRPVSALEALDRESAQMLGDVLARIVFGNDTGTFELSFEVEGLEIHRVLNWSADTDDRRSVVIVATDITAQKAAEQALADQIRYKDEFIASVSHELRTPLTAVVGLVEEIVRPEAPITTTERDDLMAIVAEQGHEVADIVEDLLVAARAAGGNLSTRPVPFDLGAAIAATLQLWTVSFDFQVEDDLHAVADPARVRQILRNLMSNAIRYGGPNRRILAFVDEGTTVIEVRDDGPPIPASRREAMFEPYERTRERTSSRPESVGLGLTVARSLAETMGGSIAYEHDGKESVFRLVLPAASEIRSGRNDGTHVQ